MLDEGLIEPELELGVTARRRGLWLSALFLAFLVGTAVIDRVWPAPAITLVGQELVDADLARQRRRVHDGSAARWVEKDLELRSRVRRTLAPWWTAILLRAAHVGSRDVIVGDEGWLFLRDRVRPPRGPYRAAVTPGVHALSAARRRLASHGTELVLVPVPRKEVVCRALLPKGIDPVPELDAYVLEALRAQGVVVVDLLAAWAHSDPRELYLSHDSHWAGGGQLAAARACLAACPRIQGAEFEAEIVMRQRFGAIAGTLEYLGIYDDHPAYRFAQPEPDRHAVVEPRALVQRFRGIRGSGEVVLAGTSFSAHFEFPLLLFGLARRDIVDLSFVGAAFGEPMTRAMLARAGSAAPRTLLYEFPLSQIWDLDQSGGGASDWFGRLFVGAPPLALSPRAATSPLPGAAQEHRRLPEPNASGIRACHVPGAVLGTGDGVVMARFTAASASGTRWRFCSSALAFDFTWPEGVTELTLPIVEGIDPDGYFELSAQDPAARTAVVDCQLVTDLDLPRSVALARATLDGALTRFEFQGDAEPGMQIGPGVGSGLLVRLGGEPAHVHRATIEATNVAGSVRTWTFDARGGALLVIDLGALAAAPLRAVSVACTLPVTELLFAPTSWAE